MNDRKKKILAVGEASFLNSGYSTYLFELYKRLHATGKYELAELGCYAQETDPRQYDLPWKFYGNIPATKDKATMDAFNADPVHSFGSWKFERVLLDFQPDIVFDIRDWWNHSYQERSPFRPYFNWTLMPAVDAIPQSPEWVSTFMNADAILSYSEWGINVLRNKYNLKNTVGDAPGGVDLETFKPVANKALHKQHYSIPANSFIIGTVMRNQKRKLFPDMINCFAEFLQKAPQELAQRSYLYMHTSYPDWWDLPKLMGDAGVSNRCLFTYKCNTCKAVFACTFQDAKGMCPKCNNRNSFLPNTHVGLNRQELASIINLFDVYIQYANSEGLGIPAIEAAACGVPVFETDYSAMSDVVRKVNGYPIKVLTLAKEAETGCDRAIPDPNDFVDKLIKFTELPDGWQKKKGFEARRGAIKHYNWDDNYSTWSNYFDSVPLKDPKGTWFSPVRYHQPIMDTREDLNVPDFVKWAIINVAGRPDMINHYMALKLVRDLQWDSTTDQISGFYLNDMSAIGQRPNRKNFSRQDALVELKRVCDYNNYWQSERQKTFGLEVTR
jgi:glycosyltransferase involved in cell wall biosynthesis